MREAIRRKGVAKTTVAKHFGIKGPSIYDWIDHGRIGKQHLTQLVAYFADVVGPEHWGLDISAQSDEFKDWRSVLGYAQAAGLGEGAAAQEYAEVHKLAFRADSLSKKHLNPDNLRVMYGKGDSMEPTIKDGDAILFDLADNTPRNRMIYVLLLDGAADEEYNVKRCKVSKGVVTFVADNPDGDHDWKEPRAAEGIKVIGRVRWTGGWVK